MSSVVLIINKCGRVIPEVKAATTIALSLLTEVTV